MRRTYYDLEDLHGKIIARFPEAGMAKEWGERHVPYRTTFVVKRHGQGSHFVSGASTTEANERAGLFFGRHSGG